MTRGIAHPDGATPVMHHQCDVLLDVEGVEPGLEIVDALLESVFVA